MACRLLASGCLAGALALGVLPATGCSWLLVQDPPQGPVVERPPLGCTATVVAPVADTVAAVLFGATGAILLYEGARAPAGGSTDPAAAEKAVVVGVGVGGLGVATAFGFSAGRGYSATSECRGMKDAQRGLPERKP